MIKVQGVFVAAAIVVFVLLAVCTVQAQEDTIWIGDMKLDRVEIEKETYEEIYYKIGRSVQIVPTEEVDKIIHGDAPHLFLMAEDARKNGNWEEAVKQYRSCIRYKKENWVKAYSRFYLAECYRLWGKRDSGKLKEAMRAYEKFLSEHGKHRFAPRAAYGKALTALQSNKLKKAGSAYKELASQKYGIDWSIKGRLGLVRLTLKNKQMPQQDILRRLIKDAEREEMPNVAAEGKLFLSKLLVSHGEYKDGIAILGKLLKEYDESGKRIVAAAHNQLGDCYLRLSSETKDMKKALFEYLKVVVLYSEVQGEYLKALEKAIALLEKIGADKYKKRANELRAEYQKASRSSGQE